MKKIETLKFRNKRMTLIIIKWENGDTSFNLKLGRQKRQLFISLAENQYELSEDCQDILKILLQNNRWARANKTGLRWFNRKLKTL